MCSVEASHLQLGMHLEKRKFDIPEDEDADTKTLHAFGNTIREIADVDREVTAADLLATAPFKTISYNPDKNIITGFTRQ